MKVFPRDPKRRAEWAANVGRKNWSPTNSSFLCEVSFGVWSSFFNKIKYTLLFINLFRIYRHYADICFFTPLTKHDVKPT